MTMIELPAPSTDGDLSVEAAIAARRSRRSFSKDGISLAALSQILWCAQGVTGPGGRRRAAPSAGGTYPIDLYVAIAPDGVGDLAGAVYSYEPGDHVLQLGFEGDVRGDLSVACLGQDFLEPVPVNLLMAAEVGRTASRYGERAERYVHMEAGHISENVHLQAEALGLGTVAVGAFRDAEVARVFRLESRLAPLYIMPVGVPV
jgi:SagB-type dehydrogenase family enzyme